MFACSRRTQTRTHSLHRPCFSTSHELQQHIPQNTETRTETHKDTTRHTKAHKGTQRHNNTQTKTHTHTKPWEHTNGVGTTLVGRNCNTCKHEWPYLATFCAYKGYVSVKWQKLGIRLTDLAENLAIQNSSLLRIFST